ncbi:MAG: dipeptidase PepE [Alistipes communis]
MPRIGEFLRGVREVAFVPYAAVTFSYADYERRVQARFSELGIRVRSVHRAADPAAMIRRARSDLRRRRQHLRAGQKMQEQGLMRAIRNRVKAGVPYVGWSAGSNVACPAISTTNDMPIVEPESFRAVGAVKFQINPHYLDANPEGHAGETREVRLLEFVAANPRRYAVGLREGCMLRYENGRLELLGSRPMRIFKKGLTPYEVQPGDDLSFLL